jgi:hypothetical protein
MHMLKEITFYADFVKKRWCDNNKKKKNLRTFFFGTQKKKKTVIAYAYMRYAGRNHSLRSQKKEELKTNRRFEIETSFKMLLD